MGLPGHRRTSSHKRRRASHFALGKLNLSACASCRAPIPSHRVCHSCGMYAGRKVMNVSLAKQQHIEAKHKKK